MPGSRQIFLTALLAVLFTAIYSLPAQTYRVGVRAHKGTEEAVRQWSETLAHLSRTTPYSFELIPVISLKEISETASRGGFDFLLTNPSSYVEINELYGAESLVTLVNKRADTAQDRFGSVIFVHALRDDIRTIEDLKGKTLMSVSRYAFGGWRVAWHEMLKHGIDPYSDLKSVQYTENSLQQEVVHAVLSRKVDAGVVRTDQLERMEAAGKLNLRYLRILNNRDINDFPFFLSTDLYPEWSFAAMKNIPDDAKKAVRDSLLGIKKDSRAAVSGQYVGWAPSRSYEEVRVLLQNIKAGPWK